MLIFVGNQTDGIQDLAMAQNLIEQAAKDYEAQYGLDNELTREANGKLLSVYQMSAQRELTIQQAEKVMQFMRNDSPSNVNTIEYAQILAVQAMS